MQADVRQLVRHFSRLGAVSAELMRGLQYLGSGGRGRSRGHLCSSTVAHLPHLPPRWTSPTGTYSLTHSIPTAISPSPTHHPPSTPFLPAGVEQGNAYFAAAMPGYIRTEPMEGEDASSASSATLA